MEQMRVPVGLGSAGVTLTPEQLSARWGGRIKIRTLANWRSLGKGPPWFRPGGGSNGPVLYRLRDVEQWEREHRREADIPE